MFLPWIGRALGAPMAVAAALHKKRFDADARRAQEVNDEALLAILHHNRDTDFGRRHGFAGLRTVADFRRALPVATYDDFRDDIARIARGEHNVLTADRVTHLGVTSGTTGTGKMIPMTAESRKLVATAMILLVQGFLADSVPAARLGGRGMLLMSAVLPKRTEGGLPAGPSTSVGMAGMLRMSDMLWTSPPEVYQVPRQADAMYLHLLFGLTDPSLRYVSAPFASGVLDLFHTLERAWPRIVDDIGRGSIDADLDIPPELRARLAARLRPRPALAESLGREFARGMDGIARRAFPGIGWINTVCGGSFAVYAEKLARYTGDLPMYSSVYGSTEAMLGVGVGPGRPVYVMTPRAAFFELIPAESMDAPAPETRLLGEVEEGKRYEVVVTTRAGLYRYRMGDVVEVVGRHGQIPVVDFLYRRGGLLNLVGEKTSEDAAYAALAGALAREGLDLYDYTVHGDIESAPERYVFFVELLPGQRAPDPGSLSTLLDTALSGANPFYEVMRRPEKLGKAVFCEVEQGTFQLLKEVQIRRGASPSQAKVPRAVRDPEMLALLRSRVRGLSLDLAGHGRHEPGAERLLGVSRSQDDHACSKRGERPGAGGP